MIWHYTALCSRWQGYIDERMSLKHAKCNLRDKCWTLQSAVQVWCGWSEFETESAYVVRNQSKSSDLCLASYGWTSGTCQQNVALNHSHSTSSSYFLSMPCQVAALQYLLDQSPYNCHATMRHDTIRVDRYKQCWLRYAINHWYGTTHQCYRMDTEDCIVADMVMLQGIQHGWCIHTAFSMKMRRDEWVF